MQSMPCSCGVRLFRAQPSLLHRVYFRNMRGYDGVEDSLHDQYLGSRLEKRTASA